MCVRVCSVCSVCKSCGAFVLVVKHFVRIHFLSIVFSLFLFAFLSYRIVRIAFPITTHRHLFVLHGFKERFDSAQSLSCQAHSAPPPPLSLSLHTHIPLGHRRASTAHLRLHLGPHTLDSHPDNIVIWIDSGPLYGSSIHPFYRILYSVLRRVDSPVIPASLKSSSSIHYTIVKS